MKRHVLSKPAERDLHGPAQAASGGKVFANPRNERTKLFLGQILHH